MAKYLKYQQPWIFSIAALAVWFTVAWPVLQALIAGAEIRNSPVPALWLVPFALFGAAVVAGMVPRLPGGFRWALLAAQLGSVVAMAILVNWAMIAMFLILVAWQAAMATTPFRALSWVVLQSLLLLATLALVPNPDTCWVHWMAFGLQLVVLFTANALRREAETAQALARAQAVIASTARDAERLRISRELHDAWGHELTALGLQLEIASHVTEPGRAKDHVLQAKALSGALLGKVRDVVATLRDADRCNLKESLQALAQSVPTPAVHVEIAPEVRVTPDQAHALMRCAQEAVTNAVRHADAANLWLEVTLDSQGVRLVARNDGPARPTVSSPGSGLLGMRERVESLGGRLAVRKGDESGFTVDAWLPSRAPKPA
jgi:signal transduction histidine kinase